MRVSREWLETFIDIKVPTDELAETITRGGIEVDDLIDYTKDIKKLVVGYVKSVKPHPEADRLNLCEVDTGEETTQIVCGAPNVQADSYVIVSKVGGRLPGGIKIKRAKLRGEVSEGMICSLEEIGVKEEFVPAEYQGGIFMFKSEQTPGEDALNALYLDDQVLEFDLTPNRKDALSMIGAAYETRALFGGEVEVPEASVFEADDLVTMSVENEDAEAVPFYAVREVRDVEIKPAPLWMQIRLIKAGIRPINNVVDISNYVLMEYGQPLHMFDRDRIGSDKVVTRFARENEKFTTLDGKERTLNTEDIVITNGEVPIALAGVMGGRDSEVTEQTVNVVIESALFDPVKIRKASSRLNLRSEASQRFEKGVSHEFILPAVNRAAYLLEKYAGGKTLKGIASEGQLDLEPGVIQTSADFINNRLGTELTVAEILGTLQRLGLGAEEKDGAIDVLIPSRRDDLKIPEDISEEVARIFGYDNIPSTLPEYSVITPGRLSDEQQEVRVIKRQLNAQGFSQAINYALTSKKRIGEFTTLTDSLALLMPMSEDRAVLRNSLVPHLVDNATYNVNRQQKNVSLFEIGKIFKTNGQDQLPDEIEMLAGIVTGDQHKTAWTNTSVPSDFYTVKGVLESLFEKLGLVDRVTYKQSSVHDELHPGRTAEVYLDDKVIGFAGELHPQYAEDHDLGQTAVFEINLAEVLRVKTGSILYEFLPKYPSMSRDVALEVESGVQVSDIIGKIKTAAPKYLADVYPFDVYEGEHIADGKKSVALHLTYLNKEKTLTDKDIEALHTPVEEALKEAGYILRG
ncbi:phenylalanine--tRNA ligase subunit beta [Jeotgalicoccus nanhaiensis]|uniref:Phenylalanine--tRNA ligase beta subunit n=1 Tax=Jeotgalicoccus nanhaiensis TaxID=568603 RepID=A0ABR9XYE4_9STAP|nr:phenylalanine--tRNA ligase subunit beta [Jeotgalicoccus nanhaiensis]MBF0754018.1 phenylalanine--tRNA ligase subunit beta [Jeotgalicoccus nanhaiensis]TFU61505.1 phenylalanine--tRNA ligase subunit beta [Jeotgalicoccus nanhaiensis]